jgi:hypothetical protein
MTKADVIRIINQVGEDFGWQMGKVGANYENGYMKAIRDCKQAFNHIVDSNKMIVGEIVRCKDCIYYSVSRLECRHPHCNGLKKCDGFCDNACTRDGKTNQYFGRRWSND